LVFPGLAILPNQLRKGRLIRISHPPLLRRSACRAHRPPKCRSTPTSFVARRIVGLRRQSGTTPPRTSGKRRRNADAEQTEVRSVKCEKRESFGNGHPSPYEHHHPDANTTLPRGQEIFSRAPPPRLVEQATATTPLTLLRRAARW
jgi:hypothetical protein